MAGREPGRAWSARRAPKVGRAGLAEQPRMRHNGNGNGQLSRSRGQHPRAPTTNGTPAGSAFNWTANRTPTFQAVPLSGAGRLWGSWYASATGAPCGAGMQGGQRHQSSGRSMAAQRHLGAARRGSWCGRNDTEQRQGVSTKHLHAQMVSASTRSRCEQALPQQLYAGSPPVVAVPPAAAALHWRGGMARCEAQGHIAHSLGAWAGGPRQALQSA